LPDLLGAKIKDFFQPQVDRLSVLSETPEQNTNLQIGYWLKAV